MMSCGQSMRFTLPFPAFVLLVPVAVAPAFTGRAEAAPMPVASRAVAGDADLGREPSWTMPGLPDVRRRVLAWLAETESARRSAVQPLEPFAAARALWPAGDDGPGGTAAAGDLLDRVMATFAAVDPRCAAIESALRAAGGSMTADIGWLADPGTAGLQRDAVRLWIGRQYVRQDRFDDALTLLADLDTATAVDPAALLFHRAACQHWLLAADAAIESLERLLERADDIPVRYERMARLMRADLTTLEDESLDHIARRMRDITRRLDQGRPGPQTRRVQDGVIESLDKLIAAIEEQQNQQNQSGGGGSAGGSGNSGSGKPMDDSRIAGGKGPGEVTKRDLGDTDGWGNLPPHKREEALQQIGREFPAHYREAIEQYFKRLASGDDTP
jgi:hypothetical protein